MDTSDQKEKIQSQLEVIGSLSPGLTLSASTMTVVDHRTWGTSFWRLYARENRQQSIDCIEDILDNALNILKEDPSENLANNIKIALKGFGSLKETYSGSQDIIENIESIIAYVKNNLIDAGFEVSECSIEGQKNNAEYDLREMVEKVVRDIKDENIPEDRAVLGMTNDPDDSSAQKIRPGENNEGIIRSTLENTSDLEQMVETSDRADCQETADGTIRDNVEGNVTEDNNSVCASNAVCLDNIQKPYDIDCGIKDGPAFSKSNQNIILETENTTISNMSLGDHNNIENRKDFDESEKKTMNSNGPNELGLTSNGSLKIMNPTTKKTSYGYTLGFIDGKEVSVEKNIAKRRTRNRLHIFASKIAQMYSGMIRKETSSKFLVKRYT